MPRNPWGDPMPQQAPVQMRPDVKCSGPGLVHLADIDGPACHGRGDSRTSVPAKVTCPGCRQTGTYQKLLARFRRPIETRDDSGEAYERQVFWAAHLRKMDLHRAQGVEVRKMRTGAGTTWGIFITPWEDDAGLTADS